MSGPASRFAAQPRLPFAHSHLIVEGGHYYFLSHYIPEVYGRRSFGHGVVGRGYVDKKQWAIDRRDGTYWLINIGDTPTAVWYANGDPDDPLLLGQNMGAQLVDGCTFGLRYWEIPGAGDESRRALCSFWDDSIAD